MSVWPNLSLLHSIWWHHFKYAKFALYVKISNIFLQIWNICMKMKVSMHYEPISPAIIMSILHQGVITPFLGQLWAGCRKSNKYHRIPHKITYRLVPNMPRYAILHTKIIILHLGTSLFDCKLPLKIMIRPVMLHLTQ